jgi:hypothetical protein
MSAESPILRSLSDALGEMIHAYAAGDWTPSGEDYLRVTIDRQAYSYEAACGLIDNFDDPLPDDLLHRLLANTHLGDEGAHMTSRRTSRIPAVPGPYDS